MADGYKFYSEGKAIENETGLKFSSLIRNIRKRRRKKSCAHFFNTVRRSSLSFCFTTP